MQMPFPFNVFRDQCARKKYFDPIDQTQYTPPQWIYAIRTNNGIKCEIKPKKFTIGLQSPYLEDMRLALEAAGYEFSKKRGNTTI